MVEKITTVCDNQVRLVISEAIWSKQRLNLTAQAVLSIEVCWAEVEQTILISNPFAAD